MFCIIIILNRILSLLLPLQQTDERWLLAMPCENLTGSWAEWVSVPSLLQAHKFYWVEWAAGYFPISQISPFSCSFIYVCSNSILPPPTSKALQSFCLLHDLIVRKSSTLRKKCRLLTTTLKNKCSCSFTKKGHMAHLFK